MSDKNVSFNQSPIVGLFYPIQQTSICYKKNEKHRPLQTFKQEKCRVDYLLLIIRTNCDRKYFSLT